MRQKNLKPLGKNRKKPCLIWFIKKRTSFTKRKRSLSTHLSGGLLSKQNINLEMVNRVWHGLINNIPHDPIYLQAKKMHKPKELVFGQTIIRLNQVNGAHKEKNNMAFDYQTFRQAFPISNVKMRFIYLDNAATALETSKC